ncbi:hypothetical protein [Lysobacter rhizosphaerae]
MRYLVKPVLVLSAIGLVLSVIVHIIALLGFDPRLGESVFALHVGIFVVWFPAVFLSMRMGRGKKASAWGFGGSWKQVLSGCPGWMTYLLYVLFAYTFLNFFLFMGSAASGASQVDSASSPQVIRGFSGHWMVFYYAAFAIAYSALMKPELLGDAVCKMGHKALPIDKFCSECGNPVVVKKGS